MDDRKRLGAALVVVLVGAALLLWLVPEEQHPPELTPGPVGARVVEEQYSGGMTGSYDETIDGGSPCRPEEWRVSVDFELRRGEEVVVSQTVLDDGCRVVCGVSQGPCGEGVSPTWDLAELEPGVYQVWARARWNNLVDGREVIAHPAALVPAEDWRHFLYVEDVCLGACYLPVILIGY